MFEVLLNRHLVNVTVTRMAAGSVTQGIYAYLGTGYYSFLPHPKFRSNVCS
jgi:hypothetical protein